MSPSYLLCQIRTGSVPGGLPHCGWLWNTSLQTVSNEAGTRHLPTSPEQKEVERSRQITRPTILAMLLCIPKFLFIYPNIKILQEMDEAKCLNQHPLHSVQLEHNRYSSNIGSFSHVPFTSPNVKEYCKVKFGVQKPCPGA